MVNKTITSSVTIKQEECCESCYSHIGFYIYKKRMEKILNDIATSIANINSADDVNRRIINE